MSSNTFRSMLSPVVLALVVFMTFSSISLADSSAQRSSKKFGGTARIGAALGMSFGAIGAEGLTNLGSDLQVGGMFYMDSVDMKPDLAANDTAEVKTTKVEVSANVVAAFGRYFVGNSFNVTAGIGYRQYSVAFGIAATDAAIGSVDVDVTVNSIVLMATIGNQWVLDSGLIIGCDWIGTMLPLSSEYTANTSTAGAVSSELSNFQDSSTELGKSLGDQSTNMALLFHVGWMM